MPDNATPTTAVAKRDNSPVGQFAHQLEARARDIQKALPAHITPDKFQRTVLTAAAQSPDLLTADRNSFILAIYKAAQDALLPDGREAAFVVFRTSRKVNGRWEKVQLVQYMPMVYGLRKKILQSGDVVALEVGVVYKIEAENGYFRYEVGTEPPLNHAPMLDIPDDEATDDKIIAAYSIATMKDGTKSYEVMRRSEINKVRQMSQTGAEGKTDRDGKPIPPKGPWVDWFAEMAKKTVMRRHAKTLPMSGDVLIDVEGRELERSGSAAFALGSVTPGAPQQIEDRYTDESGDTIDSTTGEVIEEGNDTHEASGTAPDDASADGAASEGGEVQPQADADDLFDDREAENRANNERMATELIELFSSASNVPELKKRYDGSALELSALPDDLADNVEGAYDRNLKRLGTTRAKVAKVLGEMAARETESAK